MYLAEVEAPEGERADAAPVRLPSDRWKHFPFSQLSHHGAPCCETARQWLVAMDFAQLNGADLSSGPRWLRARYKWGPSSWPMHWCEVVKRDVVDCGAHAAMAYEVFTARGLTAFPAQLVQTYSEDSTEQWRGSWQAEDVSCHWLDGEHIYHEVTAVLVGDALKLWDGSAGSWVNPRQNGGYGAVAAVRIFADGEHASSEAMPWGERLIAPNVWNQID